MSAAVLAVYLAAVVVPAALHPNTDGFAAYYTASRILLRQPRDVPRLYDDVWFQSRIDEFGFAGVRDIYNIQPPTMTLLLAPVAWMPRPLARAVWVALAAACWFGGCALLYRLVSSKSLGLRSLVVLAALTTAYLPLRENFKRGQCYALLLLLLVAHFRLLIARRAWARWAAGVPLGFMLAIKVAGAWLWPLLLLSRRWRTVVAAAAACLAVSLAASTVFGWAAWEPYLRELPRLSHDPMRDTSGYQTVTSFFGHLLVRDPIYSPRPVANLPVVARCATALVILWAIVQSVRSQRLDHESFQVRALSIGVLDALVVSMAPIAETYHYLLVLPAVVIAWSWALETRPSTGAWATLAAASVLLMIPQTLYVAPRIQAGWIALLAYPRVYGAFILWGWLITALDKLVASRDREPGRSEGAA
jgi:hypothetical protein